MLASSKRIPSMKAPLGEYLSIVLNLSILNDLIRRAIKRKWMVVYGVLVVLVYYPPKDLTGTGIFKEYQVYGYFTIILLGTLGVVLELLFSARERNRSRSVNRHTDSATHIENRFKAVERRLKILESK